MLLQDRHAFLSDTFRQAAPLGASLQGLCFCLPFPSPKRPPAFTPGACCFRYWRPATDPASLPTRVTTRYRPFMGHYYRFKRGDPVIILSGRYRGHQGVIDSAVFQRTVDFPGEFAPGSTVVAP